MELNYTGPHCHGAAVITIHTQGVEKFVENIVIPPPVSYQDCLMAECCQVLKIYWCTHLSPTCAENSCNIAERWHYEVFRKEITCVFFQHFIGFTGKIKYFSSNSLFDISDCSFSKKNTRHTIKSSDASCLQVTVHVFSAQACWAALPGDDGRETRDISKCFSNVTCLHEYMSVCKIL